MKVGNTENEGKSCHVLGMASLCPVSLIEMHLMLEMSFYKTCVLSTGKSRAHVE